MKRRKANRNALFTSVISLLLCVSMLVGTTFAWFTDSVVTGINTIAAGNLDVELYHTNAVAKDEKVDASTYLFRDLQGDPILWEPGVVSYENLRVVNEGSLALAYQMAINTANENYVLDPSGAQYGLSQILKVGVVEDGITATDRAGVVASVAEGSWTTLADFLRNGSLLPEDGENEKTWGIVIYWEPGENDNLWNLNNGKTLSEGEELQIDLGISLIATQEQYESDAFGSDYDSEAKAAVFPEFAGGTAGADVAVDGANLTTAEVTMTSGAVSAVVPAGVKVAAGVSKLTLTVTPMDASGANISLGDNEDMRSLDVHIEGVDPANTTPIVVTLKEVAPTGLNMGNYKLYHVENGTTKEMTLVDSAADFTKHNQFKYDPATGDIVLYMATFSEVTVVADLVKAWEGGVDHSWYDGKQSPYYIANADQLWSFSQIVGGMAEGIDQDSFEDKTVKLISDVNLGDGEENNKSNLIFYPIGYWNNEGTYERKALEERTTAVDSGLYSFMGTFDGNGHTIANFYHNTWEMKGDHNWYDPIKEQYYRDGMGLFGKIYGGTVKNLTIDNFKSDGEIATTGCIAAYADGATFENIAIFNCNPRVYNIGNGGIVGCVGWYAKEANLKTTFKNITVDNSNKISALWGSYDVACGGIVGQYYPTSGQTSAGSPKNAGIDLVNCHVAAQMDVYNDVCGNYQYYAYRYAGMMIGSIRENTTTVIDGVTKTIPDMTGITATGCTVNYGDWNDYYYCEFEKNGHPSYSGPNDYKFSRVPDSELNFTDSNGNGKVDADERASVTGCKHNHTDAEDNKAIYLPFHQLFTGYGWGVNSIGLEKYNGIVTNLDITEGDQEASVEKFEKKLTAEDAALEAGQVYKVGDLFTAIDGANINGSAVQVAVTAVNDSGITAVYAANTTDWTKGTLTFNKIDGLCAVTIQDYNFCKPTTIILKDGKLVENVEKFAIALPNADKYLYRVGNQNAIELKSLFKENGYPVDDANVSISTSVGSNCEVKLDAATWENGTINFEDSFTGIATVTIKEGNSEKKLTLEVVDAWNATSAISAPYTYNGVKYNVVLLNDVEKAANITVADGYSFYGNGFALKYTSDGAYGSRALGFGFVTVKTGGQLDNVQVLCSLFPESYLYTSDMKQNSNGVYPYAYSAVVVSGNSAITNCYIYGARNNIYVTHGNITIRNTVLENGSFANVHIKSTEAYTVTLDNMKTIQTPRTVVSSVDNKNKNVLGFAVAVGDTDSTSHPTIKLEGNLVQNNWVTQEMANTVSNIYAQQAIEGALDVSEYIHTNNSGDKTVNMGIAYLNSLTVANNKVIDNHTNTDITYKLQSVRISGYNGYVYSITNGGNPDTNSGMYVPETNDNISPSIVFENVNSNVTFEDVFDTTSESWTGLLTVDLDKIEGNSYNFSFDDLKVKKHGVDLRFEVTDKDGKKVNTDETIVLNKLEDQKFTLVVIDDQIYDANGNDTDLEATRYLNFTIKAIKTSIPDPTITYTYAGSTNASLINNKDILSLGDYKNDEWRPTINALKGVVITYWDAEKKETQTVDLSTLDLSNANNYTINENVWTYTEPNGKYTLTLTGGYIYQTSGRITPIVSKAVDNTSRLYFCSTQKAYAANGNDNRTIDITYKIVANNSEGTHRRNETVTFSASELTDFKFSDFKNGTLKEAGNKTCVTGDTLVTLADGTQKRIEDMTGKEILLVWNHSTGMLEAIPAVNLVKHSNVPEEHEIIHLYFSDGHDVKVIGEHVFFDNTLNLYVPLDKNAAEYIGHDFAMLDGNKLGIAKLIRVEKETETTIAYEINSYQHLTCFTNGILSASAYADQLLNIFDIDPNTMAYNEDKIVECLW